MYDHYVQEITNTIIPIGYYKLRRYNNSLYNVWYAWAWTMYYDKPTGDIVDTNMMIDVRLVSTSNKVVGSNT